MKSSLQAIKLLALDVDGVLTDGRINISAEGELFKAFDAKDGLGISCALRSGLHIAVITGRASDIVRRRAAELGINIICQGVQDKFTALEQLRADLQLRKEETAYMGDDLNDLPAFAAAGIRFAPADAAKEVLEAADFRLASRGGRGAVREALQMILQAQGVWEQIVAACRNCGYGDRQ